MFDHPGKYDRSQIGSASPRDNSHDKQLDCASRQLMRRRLLVAAMLLVGCAGCDEHIDTYYGKRSFILGRDSVNGTAVFAGMFQQAGHRVLSKRTLTQRIMEDCDVIVWAPNDYQPPPQAVLEWLDDWLSHGDRSLILIGRDFDAGPVYYEKVIPGAPQNQATELRLRQGEAVTHDDNERAVAGTALDCDWYHLDMTTIPKKVTSLEGPWSDGVDPANADIRVRGKLEPKLYVSSVFVDEDRQWEEYVEEEDENVDDESDTEATYLEIDAPEVLLRSNKDILISRQSSELVSDSYLYIVNNGSFLLNFPLVNNEHRKLAARFIGEIDKPKTVVFLESDEGGPAIREKEPVQDVPTGLSLFGKRPWDVILFHFALLGIVFCLMCWPVFGRRRRYGASSTSDFGKHVTALGRLLEATGDDLHAMSRINHYKQTVHSSAGETSKPAHDSELREK